MALLDPKGRPSLRVSLFEIPHTLAQEIHCRIDHRELLSHTEWEILQESIRLISERIAVEVVSRNLESILQKINHEAIAKAVIDKAVERVQEELRGH